MKRSLATLLAALGCVGAIDPARAALFCASNGTQLQQALAAAQGNGQADTIRLTVGTFVSTSSAGFSTNNSSTDLEVEGGWLSVIGDCNVRIDDATLTVIDGQNVRPGLRIGVSNSNGVSGDVVVRNITFANGLRQPPNDDRGGGLYISAAAGFTGDVLIERNVFRSNVASYLGGGVHAASDGGIVTVRNNLSVGNTAFEAAGIYAFGNDATTYVSNNTVAGNVATSTNTAIAAYDRGGSSTVFASNNIFWNNTTAAQSDLSAESGTTVLVTNDIQRLSGTPQGPSSGNVAADPRFVAPGDYRLREDSPLLDDGATPPIGGLSPLDLAGEPRVGNGFVDLGAFELDRVFSNGFE